ncbi:2Fe-2S iron-sulfur cluster binding domain-containing protein [Bordetella sp. BOR01]|uniref:2Fe-2S iron-sulfur cluster-binding protein n=1 Tax=Bordetella sp. BOR01 TaxID=2854779 RepID=UPI001C44094F|nr:2Fe-2S iron-sulfur cluster binding domain-containing protein [Bordetella sp. BOR01]MBV7485818.1 2Fe-2S iron-sulfur cluster binding domain-containing protein [Bordetella sp. BOR01]
MHRHAITLIFSDGESRRFDAEPGAGLVPAAEQAGYHLLADCGEGNCGTCMASLLSGSVSLGEYDRYTLVDEDRASGAILPCVSSLDGPCVIEFPYEFSECMAAQAAPARGCIAGVQRVAAQTLRLDVTLEQAPDFLPGQYVHLGPPQADWTRAFSMANAPGADCLSFYVRELDNGRFSGWLGQVDIGQEISVGAPRGAFFLRDEARPRLFVAGGTGLAPIMSMLQVLADSPAPEAPLHIVVGARSGAHLFARDKLAELAARIPGAQVHWAAEHDAPAGCHAGRVTDLIEAMALAADTRAYVCGPPAMVEAVRQSVVKAGAAGTDVLCERFS